MEDFAQGLDTLTSQERYIYEAYLSGTSTKDIMIELNIKENTLKFHNKNLYSKLGVSSRKQLLEVYRAIKADMKKNGDKSVFRSRTAAKLIPKIVNAAKFINKYGLL